MLNYIQQLFSGLHTSRFKTREKKALENLIRLTSGATGMFIPVKDVSGRKPFPTVLIVHGWKSTVYTSTTYVLVREELCKAGFNTFSVSLRGHEQSGGDINTVSRNDHLRDITEALTYLAGRKDVDYSTLSALGASYGAYLLAITAGKQSLFSSLVLRAPALYPDGDMNIASSIITDDPEVKLWRTTVHTRSECLALRQLGQYGGNMLIVQSEHDNQIPPQVVESYCKAVTQETIVTLEVIPGAAHALVGDQRSYFAKFSAGWLRASANLARP